jgi:hypothetical protein
MGAGAELDDETDDTVAGAVGAVVSFGVILEDRRQRLKNPNMHFPANH